MQSYKSFLDLKIWSLGIISIFALGLFFSRVSGVLHYPCAVTNLNLTVFVDDKLIGTNQNMIAFVDGEAVSTTERSPLEIEITSGQKVIIIADMETEPPVCSSPVSPEWRLLPSSDVTLFSTRPLVTQPGELLEYIGYVDARDATVITDKIFVTISQTEQQPLREAVVNIQVRRTSPQPEREP
jgi:hypothetical protein